MKDKLVPTYLEREDYKVIKQHAAERGISVAAVLREMCLELVSLLKKQNVKK